MTVSHDARDEALAILGTRALTATICPSEVARSLARKAQGGPQSDWRSRMGEVHAAIDGLVEDGLVCLSWKGKAMGARAGPYRIRGAPRS